MERQRKSEIEQGQALKPWVRVRSSTLRSMAREILATRRKTTGGTIDDIPAVTIEAALDSMSNGLVPIETNPKQPQAQVSAI